MKIATHRKIKHSRRLFIQLAIAMEEEEEEMNECEICGCNMTEENTRYVEDSDTIIMCDKCEE